MSDEAKPAKSSEDALLGLTSLDFGPAWARGGDDKKKGGSGEGKGKLQRDDRGDRGEARRDHRQGGRRDDRGGGRRDDRGGG
ncbi:MAG: hypothetical protein OSB65_20015, partial [Roseibacillus sp.]|nr:hypothetical protein [Roseibacillus sp.]